MEVGGEASFPFGLDKNQGFKSPNHQSKSPIEDSTSILNQRFLPDTDADTDTPTQTWKTKASRTTTPGNIWTCGAQHNLSRLLSGPRFREHVSLVDTTRGRLVRGDPLEAWLEIPTLKYSSLHLLQSPGGEKKKHPVVIDSL